MSVHVAFCPMLWYIEPRRASEQATQLGLGESLPFYTQGNPTLCGMGLGREVMTVNFPDLASSCWETQAVVRALTTYQTSLTRHVWRLILCSLFGRC